QQRHGDPTESFTIKAGLGPMLRDKNSESGRLVYETIQDAVNRFNLITFLASLLMTLHGKPSWAGLSRAEHRPRQSRHGVDVHISPTTLLCSALLCSHSPQGEVEHRALPSRLQLLHLLQGGVEEEVAD